MKWLKHTDYRQWLFSGLMVLLSIPLFQSVTGLFREQSLKGAVTVAPDTALTARGWFDNTWQPAKEKRFNDTFGFRSLFIRINNQIALSLFREVHAFSVIFGKENYLFEENYIKAWYGADFIGEEVIRERISRLKYIQDELKSRYNKTLLVVFTAGKGSFYPEYFPPDIVYPKGPTNYEAHIRLASEKGLEVIDFNDWFLKQKATSPYPLYPQYGIHWSHYGAVLAADSIIRRIEAERGIDMPSLEWDRVRIRKACLDDYDMGYGLNLLFKLKREKMAYPEIRFESDSLKVKPSVLVVADSFYWGMFKFGITRAFSTSDFWFYNKEIYRTVTGKPGDTAEVSLREQIQNHDVIILMVTEANLPRFGWGFIEQTHHLLSEED